MSSRPQRKYTAAGRRFEDALRVERDRQIAELRAENEKLRAAVRDSILVEANMFARLQVAEAEVKRLKDRMEEKPVYKEECRRCGEVFEKDEPEMQGTCERCQRADWEEGDDRPSL
jgi:predicted Zn-ribbon and HTH transcriptional regulator